MGNPKPETTPIPPSGIETITLDENEVGIEDIRRRYAFLLRDGINFNVSLFHYLI